MYIKTYFWTSCIRLNKICKTFLAGVGNFFKIWYIKMLVILHQSWRGQLWLRRVQLGLSLYDGTAGVQGNRRKCLISAETFSLFLIGWQLFPCRFFIFPWPSQSSRDKDAKCAHWVSTFIQAVPQSVSTNFQLLPRMALIFFGHFS